MEASAEASAALLTLGVPPEACDAFAKAGVTIEALRSFQMEFALYCLKEQGVVLSEWGVKQLALAIGGAPPAAQEATGSAVQDVLPVAQTPPPQAPATVQLTAPGMTTVLQPGERAWWFHKCGQVGCECKASSDGTRGEACCKTCREGRPCKPKGKNHGFHDRPFEYPEGWVPCRMPTTRAHLFAALDMLPPHGLSARELRRTKVEQLQDLIGKLQAEALEADMLVEVVNDTSYAGSLPGQESSEHELQSAAESEDDEPPARPMAKPAARQASKAEKKAKRAVARRALFDELSKEFPEERDQRDAAAAEQGVAMAAAMAAHAADEDAAGRTMLALAADVGSNMLTALEGVTPGGARAAIKGLAQAFTVTERMVRQDDWTPETVISAVQTQLTEAVFVMGQPFKTLIENNARIQNLRARISLTVSTMASVVNSGAARRSEPAGAARVNPALKAAADKLGAEGPNATVARLQQLANDAAQDESKGGALRKAARGAVEGPYGPTVAFMLSQEKLDAPKGAMLSSNAAQAWTQLGDVGRQLLAVRAERFRKKLPPGVDVKALVAAVTCGKLTVAAMVPAKMLASKSSKAPAELREAIMRAWPGMMAIVRETHPTDEDAEDELLKLAVTAFDPAYVELVEELVTTAFAKMTVRFERYLLAGGAAPRWAAVLTHVKEEQVLSLALKSFKHGHGAAAPPSQPTKAEAEAAAKGKAERAAAAAAAAAKLTEGDAPRKWVPTAEFVKLSLAEQTVLHSAHATKKELAAAAAAAAAK